MLLVIPTLSKTIHIFAYPQNLHFKLRLRCYYNNNPASYLTVQQCIHIVHIINFCGPVVGPIPSLLGSSDVVFPRCPMVASNEVSRGHKASRLPVIPPIALKNAPSKMCDVNVTAFLWHLLRVRKVMFRKTYQINRRLNVVFRN